MFYSLRGTPAQPTPPTSLFALRSLAVSGMSPLLLLLSLFVLSLSSIPSIVAWGGAGHIATAKLAQSLFTPAGAELALLLLPDTNGQIAPIASWADQVRDQPNYTWSYGLHFVNTPDFDCHYDVARDCQYQGVNGTCVDGAVRNYTHRMMDPKLADQTQYREALEFFVHFAGDLHQVPHIHERHTCDGTQKAFRLETTALTYIACCAPLCSATACRLRRRPGRQPSTGELSRLELQPALTVGQRNHFIPRRPQLLEELFRLGRVAHSVAADDLQRQRGSVDEL